MSPLVLILISALAPTGTVMPGSSVRASYDNVVACKDAASSYSANYLFVGNVSGCIILNRHWVMKSGSVTSYDPGSQNRPVVLQSVLLPADQSSTALQGPLWVPASSIRSAENCTEGAGGEYDRIEEEPDGTLRRRRYMITTPCVDGVNVTKVIPLN